MNKIKNIIKWFENFDNKNIKIVGLENEFQIKLNINALPHLLGLHYINKNYRKTSGRDLLSYLKRAEVSDNEILKKVELNNKSQFMRVQARINNIVPFLKNLQNSTIFEMTNKSTNIKSNFLGVDLDNSNYRMLGIVSTPYDNYLETFLIQDNDLYFRNSKIEDPVISITEILEDGKEKLFSFDEDRQLKLDKISQSLNIDEHRTLVKATDLNKRENYFVYSGFKYYPVRPWNNEEKEMSLNEISKYLFTDGLFDNEYKNDRVDEFYAQVPDAYKDCDLFYNDTTQNLYFISDKGLQGYSKYQGADLTKELKRCFDLQDKNISKIKPSVLSQIKEFKEEESKSMKKDNVNIDFER
mgnify:CR=1 FL=1